MRILLVTETLTAGGAEAFVVRLANALVTDHEVTIAVLHGELVKDALVSRIAAGVRVERLRMPAKRVLFRIDGLLRRLRMDWSIIRREQRAWLEGIVRAAKPDIIHSHLLKADMIAAVARESYPEARHVITLHGDYAPFLHGQADPQLLNLQERMAAVVDRADAIAVTSGEQIVFVATNFPGSSRKTRTIYNGYAPWAARPPQAVRNDDLPTFGLVSRGVERKGWAKAIAAFATLPTGAARLVLVGEGPAIDRLRREAVPDGVRFAGFSPDPAEWIERFDVGLLPTEFPHESLPTVVMEYLACGKPVIATDVGEIGAMLRTPDGRLAGTLLDFDGDRISTDQLAAAMQAYLDDPALRATHAGRAAAAFAKFDMDRCAADYDAFYADVTGEPIKSSTSASH